MKFMTRKAVAHEVLNSERVQAELAVVANKVAKGSPRRARRPTSPCGHW